jgi:hypothetical protein
MARILFLPVFLIILALVVFLVLRVKAMFSLSKGSDIVLSRSMPFEGDLQELLGEMLASVKALPRVEYQSDIVINFHKVSSYSRMEAATGYCKISDRSKAVEVTRENGKITVKSGKWSSTLEAGENPWLNYWCGVNTLEEALKLFYESEMKVQAGDTGLYTQRKYIELLVLSHALPDRANEAFDKCFPSLSPVYGKDTARPQARVRNLMVRILINSLTSMPDYIETKFNIFDGENQFVCDYVQNARLLY